MTRECVNPDEHCDGDHCFHRLMLISNSIYFCFPSNNLKEQLTAKLEKIIVKAVAALVALEKLIAKKEQLTHRPCLGCFGSRKKAKKASTGIR